MSIEYDIVNTLNNENIMHDFASSKNASNKSIKTRPIKRIEAQTTSYKRFILYPRDPKFNMVAIGLDNLWVLGVGALASSLPQRAIIACNGSANITRSIRY